VAVGTGPVTLVLTIVRRFLIVVASDAPLGLTDRASPDPNRLHLPRARSGPIAVTIAVVFPDVVEAYQ
jgi:hypothetical protein